MTGGLVLRLRPHEKVFINGVVLENGDRRTRLRVRTPSANILRIRDALHPDEANTPAKRLYYMAQLVVAGEADAEKVKSELVEGISALKEAFGEKLCQADLQEALEEACEGNFFKVMRLLNRVLPHEAALLTRCTRAAVEDVGRS